MEGDIFSQGHLRGERSGRQISELINIYKPYSSVGLSNYERADSVSVSQLSLQEYCQARKACFFFYHNKSLCPECINVIKAAEIILKVVLCPLYS